MRMEGVNIFKIGPWLSINSWTEKHGVQSDLTHDKGRARELFLLHLLLIKGSK